MADDKKGMPAGYVLDQDRDEIVAPSSATPKSAPPAGYKLDQMRDEPKAAPAAAQSAPPAEKPSTWDKIKHFAGLDEGVLFGGSGEAGGPAGGVTSIGQAATPLALGAAEVGGSALGGMLAPIGRRIGKGFSEAIESLKPSWWDKEIVPQSPAKPLPSITTPKPLEPIQPTALPKPATAVSPVGKNPLPRVSPAAPAAESSRLDLGELGPVRRPPRLEPIGAPSPLRPKLEPSRVTLARTEVEPLPPGAPPEEQKFHELFGPEHQEVKDLAEWETGSPEGLKPIAKPTVESVVNQATGLKRLEPNVPLKEQLQPNASGAAVETDPIKVKYPDPEIRKFVRANGEAVVDAVGDDKELLYKLHNLKNVDVREAAVNAGIDLGTKHVGSKVGLGGEQVSRQEVLTQLLRKGHSPAEILELAKPKEKVLE